MSNVECRIPNSMRFADIRHSIFGIAMSDLTGQYLGQYELLSRINRGSTSTIYKAYQSKLDRYVAIKVLSPHVVDEEGFLDRFTQEARAVAQLDHPNIVSVYDFDQSGDVAFIVFKYVESGSLRSMMNSGPMELSLAVDIAMQIGLALGYAHKRGVIHRDVKPSNVLIGEGRWALLTDFGLAKILGGGKKLTHTGIGMGTPDYMAPEQAQGLPGDGRADLYSLGVMLYEMLAGRVPFEADSSMGVVVKHITEPPPPPRQFNPEIPLAVEKVILTAMKKDPDGRYQTAEAMIAALVRAAGPVAERATLPGFDLATVNATRMVERSREKAAPLSRGERVRVAGVQALGRVRARWSQFTRQQRMILSGATLACLVLLVMIAGLAWMRPGTLSSGQLTPTPGRIGTGTPASVTPLAPGRSLPTPELVLLSPSTAIRPGLYVKIVRPDGLDLFKEAGFDAQFVATLPAGNIVYVVQGPVQARSLSWIKVSDGVTTGWGVQDHVVAYGVQKNSP
jgi:serine/threonine-protein kinase